MTEPDRNEVHYGQAVRRIYRIMMVLGVGGAVAGAALQGWQHGLSFALGAAISWVGFGWLHTLVEGLDPNRPRPRKRVYLVVWLRYILLGGGGYAIVKIFGVNGIAALVGLFVPAAAVIAEIIYELVHEGT